MKICVVLGAMGLLGTEIVPVFGRAGWAMRAYSRAGCDVTDREAVERACDGADLVINCAAYTDVERAELNQEIAFGVNVRGARNVGRAASCARSRLMHISSDAVFDGSSRLWHAEDETPAPRSVYARSKFNAENETFFSCHGSWVVRTGALYGTGANFFDAIFAKVDRGEPLRVVTDQCVAPTSAKDLAEQILAIVEADAPSGIYHATSSGATTWYGAARVALDRARCFDTPIAPVTMAQYGRAPRPVSALLSRDKLVRLGIDRMRPWRVALDEWLASR